MTPPAAHHASQIRLFYRALEDRDWGAVSTVLSPGVTYDMPQTGEQAAGRDSYLRFNRDYPGDWHLSVRRVVADEHGAATWIDGRVGEEVLTNLAFFTFDDRGLIATIDDFWPEPYEPPAGREHLVSSD